MEIDCNVVRENGENYFKIQDFRSKTNVDDFSMKSKSTNILQLVNNVFDLTINENWSYLSTVLDPYITEIVSKMMKPIILQIFEKISRQDICFLNEKFEN